MHTTTDDPRILKVQDIAARNLAAFLRARDMSASDIARAAKGSKALTKKTIYNVLNKANPPKIQTLNAIAEVLGIPTWALLLDGIEKHPDLLKPGALKGLVGLVSSYLDCTPEKRAEIEEVGRAAAVVSRLRDKSTAT